MTEKRFRLAYEKGDEAIFEDLAHPYPRRMTNKEVENLLNEQQEMIDQLEKENKRLRECLDEADDIITSHLSDISITYWRNYCKTLGVDL